MGASLGYRGPESGVTMATTGGMPVHVSILVLQEKTLKLHRHYAGLRRLLVVVDASESTATGDTPQQALLHQLDLLIPELPGVRF